MKYILALILSIFLIGCAPTKLVVVPPNVVVNIDPGVLEYCDLLDEGIMVSTFGEVVEVYASLSMKYGVCANKQAAGVKLLKQFSNKEDKK